MMFWVALKYMEMGPPVMLYLPHWGNAVSLQGATFNSNSRFNSQQIAENFFKSS